MERHSTGRIVITCGLLLQLLAVGPLMADPASGKFDLATGGAPDSTFSFEDPMLDFDTVSPKGFLWNDIEETPPDFIEAAMFTQFDLRRIGYEPRNRDRLEIRIYTATIDPQRTALAADYARLLASRWGRINFGVMPHSPEFGEVLGGSDASGMMIVNRISVWRRGESLLVVRTTFQAEHFDTYAPAIAAFIGTLTFQEPTAPDPIAERQQTISRAFDDARPPFEYRMPENWNKLDIAGPPPRQGTYDFWLDAADAGGNLARLVAMIPPPRPVRGTPDPQALANLSGTLATTLLETLVPGTPYELTPLEQNTFDDFKTVSATGTLFVFNGKLGADPKPIQIGVLLSVGPDGTILGTAGLAPAPEDLYLTGTYMAGAFVQKLLFDAQLGYWTMLGKS